MKLIVLTRYYPLHSRSGGMETHAKNISEFFTRAGHEVHVVTTKRNDGSFGVQEENGVHIHLTNSWIKFGVFGSWWWECLSEIKKIHQESPVDYLICEGTSGYSYLASSFSQRVPCVYIAHGDVWNEIKSKYYRLPDPKAFFGIFKLALFYCLETILLRRVRILVAITKKVEREFRRLYPFLHDKIRLIPNNGVDTNQFRPMDASEVFVKYPMLKTESDVVTAVNIGRVTKEKGIQVLLKAMEKLKEVPFRVIIVGDGDYLGEAKRHVDEKDLNDSVIFLGRIPYEQVPLIYSIADIAVFPSNRRAEGQPFVLVESMACGVPSICSDVRGFHEVIEESGIGWLVKPNDSDALAAQIKQVLTIKDQLLTLKEQAVSIAILKFDMDTNIEQLCGFLDELSQDKELKKSVDL